MHQLMAMPTTSERAQNAEISLPAGDEKTPTDFAPLDSDPRSPGSLAKYAVQPEAGGVQAAAITATELFHAAEAANAAGDQEAAVEQYLACAATAESAHEWYLAAQSCERVGDFLLGPKPPTDLDRALRMYRRAAMAYENCGLFTEARNLFYRVSWLRLVRAGELKLTALHRAELLLYWTTAGFGYRPVRVIGTSVVAIGLYGLIYWLIQGALYSETGQPATLLDALYFSGITFATVGYGDLLPAPHARILAMTEGFTGAFLMGYFVVVLTHRLAKS